ncbi:ATP-binding protein [Agaribacterium sp. ZY112]|uniref:GAF domain-containing sensor histidine kinase n=1 Tax=Agaribacterium sp. ZY112 TaxID=3233574 RepID=UPI003524FE49
MQSAKAHPREQQRLTKLAYYEVLDTEAERAFDELTELAAAICETPISLISLVDDHRQWFKSRVGLDALETPKSIAFCSHAILEDHIFEVSNATEDERFADNPLVTGAPDIRFYAGAPLVSPDGCPIGTLCVIDREPKQLSDNQRLSLEILSKQVISQLELRKHALDAERNYRQQQSMLTSIAHDLRTPFNGILGLSQQLSERAEKMEQGRIVRNAHLILDSSLRVYQLLDEMLQWSTQRIGANKIELKAQSLLPLLSSSFDLLAESLALKDIKYKCEVSANTQVLGDTTLCKAIIRNLLNNAIKFTPKEGIIRISSRTTDNEVEILVFNEGTAMPEPIASQLMQNQHNGHTSTEGTEGESGTGLGLNLCQEFTQAQGGRMWLEQNDQQGICFGFSLAKAN